jgi:oxalate decarboxylase/phosphoglucose isomerase-like protein (cupin superfamily)
MSSERAGVVVGAGDGETTSSPLGGDVRFVVRGSDSGGALTALEVANPPGQGPPLHVHTAQDEAIHILDGELRWRLGDEVQSTGRWPRHTRPSDSLILYLRAARRGYSVAL